MILHTSISTSISTTDQSTTYTVKRTKYLQEANHCQTSPTISHSLCIKEPISCGSAWSTVGEDPCRIFITVSVTLGCTLMPSAGSLGLQKGQHLMIIETQLLVSLTLLLSCSELQHLRTVNKYLIIYAIVALVTGPLSESQIAYVCREMLQVSPIFTHQISNKISPLD